jgi:hypothetical protein
MTARGARYLLKRRPKVVPPTKPEKAVQSKQDMQAVQDRLEQEKKTAEEAGITRRKWSDL